MLHAQVYEARGLVLFYSIASNVDVKSEKRERLKSQKRTSVICVHGTFRLDARARDSVYLAVHVVHILEI